MMHDRTHKHPGFFHFAQIFARIASTAIWRLITYPLRSAKAQTLRSDVFNAAIRTFLAHITIPQSRYLLPSTTQRYLSFCNSQNNIPSSITVPYTHKTGASKEATAHWIGDPSAAVVILYFHGGAYFQPATSGTFLYLQNLISTLEQSTRKTVAALVVAYSLAPEASFPTQIQEGAALLRHLVSSSPSCESVRGGRRAPEEVFLVGDSAGGNIALGVVSHVLKPWLGVEEVEIGEPLGGMVLLSPSVTGSVEWDSMRRNGGRDMLPVEKVPVWGALYSGQVNSLQVDCEELVWQTNPYLEPCRAGVEWWKGLTGVVKTVNLERFVGDTFCVSNPFGDFEIPDMPETIPVDTPAPIPNDIAPNVTNRCGQFYRADVGDDCSTVTLKFNIALKDFIFLNPMLDNGCGNMWLNYSYCVQPVGDITGYPGYGGGPTLTIPPFTVVSKTRLPWIDLEPTPPSDQIIIPFANNTREDCWSYIWINDTTPESVNCWGISNYAGLTHDQFVLWNPSLDINSDEDTDPSYDYECAVQTSVSYCIALASPTPVVPVPLKPPTPRAAGEIPECIVWIEIGPDTICTVLLGGVDLSMKTFHTMNPSVGSDCNNLVVGTYYCLSTKDLGIRADDDEDDDYDPPTATTTLASTTSGVATPTPTQSGMVSGCTKFYKVQSGDGCWAIANDNAISLDDFYAWNPAVGSSCGTLQPNVYVCIGRSSLAGTTSKAASTTASPTKISSSSTKNAPSTTLPSVPGPTQTGIPKNCNKWVMQKEGVYCYDMAQTAGISLDKLYALNPALGGDCSGLWPGYAYCVGTS